MEKRHRKNEEKENGRQQDKDKKRSAFHIPVSARVSSKGSCIHKTSFLIDYDGKLTHHHLGKHLGVSLLWWVVQNTRTSEHVFTLWAAHTPKDSTHTQGQLLIPAFMTDCGRLMWCICERNWSFCILEGTDTWSDRMIETLTRETFCTVTPHNDSVFDVCSIVSSEQSKKSPWRLLFKVHIQASLVGTQKDLQPQLQVVWIPLSEENTDTTHGCKQWLLLTVCFTNSVIVFSCICCCICVVFLTNLLQVKTKYVE